MERLLFTLLRLGIGTTEPVGDSVMELLTLPMVQWQKVMSLAERQGVASIAIDGAQRLYETYGKEIKAVSEAPAEWFQWVLECAGLLTQYEQMSRMQRKVISELSEIWMKDGIRMMVFKGQANASFYPVLEHRAVGDIDCWLFGDAEKGDEVLQAHGAEIDNRWYRHSKISYKGETIENHYVMSHTRGSRRKKKMEVEFKSMAHECLKEEASGNNIGLALFPTAQFNACFLTYHGLHHFLSEGLRMKQILDWSLFLKVYQKEVDWGAYNDFCNRYKLNRFAVVMNYIAVHYLGVEFQEDCIVQDGNYAEKIIQSTLHDDDYLFSSGKSDWNVRWLLVKNMLGRDRWKYEKIAQRKCVDVSMAVHNWFFV